MTTATNKSVREAMISYRLPSPPSGSPCVKCSDCMAVFTGEPFSESPAMLRVIVDACCYQVIFWRSRVWRIVRFINHKMTTITIHL